MKKYKILGGSVLIIIAILTIGYFNYNKGGREVIKIGALLPLSGDMSLYGSPASNGIKLAVQHLNEQHKDSIVVIFEDSKGDAKTAITSFKKLVNFDNVNYVVGDLLSSTTLSIAPLSNSSKILTISPTASSSEIRSFGKYALSIYPSEIDEGNAAAKLSHILGLKSVGIIYENAPSAQTMSKTFEKAFKNIAFVEKVESNQADYKSNILKISSSDCDAIFIITYAQTARKLLRALKENKINKTFIGQSALYDNEFATFYRKLYPNENRFLLTGAFYNDNRGDKENRDFQKKYFALYKEKPNIFAAQSYDAVLAGFLLFKSMQSDSLNKEFAYNGISGKLNLAVDTNDNFGFYEINRDGEFKLLKDSE